MEIVPSFRKVVIENGYGEISVEKLKSVILAVLGQCGEVFCTKMNKILFYIDFLSLFSYKIDLKYIILIVNENISYRCKRICWPESLRTA